MIGYRAAAGLAAAAAAVAAITLTSADTTPAPAPAPQSCHARAAGALPDPSCTPGVTDPSIFEADIDQTICVPGYTAKVRPPTSYTNRLKVAQIAAYHYADTVVAHYEEDHLISLELGGALSDPRNLWPEHQRSPNPKDRVENRLHRLVCAHKISLATAQHAISTDWRTAP